MERKTVRKKRQTSRRSQAQKIKLTLEQCTEPPKRKLKHLMDERIAPLNKCTANLEPLVRTEDSPTNRCKVYVKNLPSDVKQGDIYTLFKDFGPVKEVLVKREHNYLVVTLANRANAERACTILNGLPFKGIILTVRSFRIPAVKVKNLSTFVTNELLHMAFSVFGKIEECYMLVDKEGNCIGEGIVEYSDKLGVTAAIRFCRDNCYFLTASLKPSIVEHYDPICHFDGKPETLMKKSPMYYVERKLGPRTAAPGTFEHEYGLRFVKLYEQYKNAIDALVKDLMYEESRLLAKCAKETFDRETEELRRLIILRDQEQSKMNEMYEQNMRRAGKHSNPGSVTYMDEDGHIYPSEMQQDSDGYCDDYVETDVDYSSPQNCGDYSEFEYPAHKRTRY